MKTDPLTALRNAEWDKVSKVVATGLGSLYAVGYLVVSVHLSRYGISSLELFKLHYLVAGFWCAAPLSCYFLITSAFQGIVLSWANQNPKPLKGMSARGVKAFLICGNVAFAIGLVVAFLSGWTANFRGTVKAHGVLIAEFLLLLFSIEFVWKFFTQPIQLAAAPTVTKWLFSGSVAKLFAFFIFAPLFTYLRLFSTDIYPYIPFAWGGRLPSLRCVSAAGQQPFDRQLFGKGWHATSNSSVRTTASERAIVCCHLSKRWGAGNRV